jgi:quercetin dioxygenase-like cupin family protein
MMITVFLESSIEEADIGVDEKSTRAEVKELRRKIKEQVALYRSFPGEPTTDKVPIAQVWGPFKSSPESTAIGIDVPSQFGCSVIVVDMPEGQRFPNHIHLEDLEVKVLRGAIEVSVEGVVHRLDRGSMMTIKSRVPHEVFALERSLLLKVFEPSLPLEEIDID